MFPELLAARAAKVSAALEAALSEFGTLPVHDAMRYAARGGKGLRGFLVLESARLHDVAEDRAIRAAAAIEAMHTYSLVHDDLPAMDDDDLRRGQPTVHVRWDDATAVLVGDALQTLAFKILSRKALHPDPAIRLQLIAGMAEAAGAAGMVQGQAMDIAAETAETPLTLNEITVLQANKTGALITWSATAGAVLAGAATGPLQTYARALGLAFQIADDILDVTGDSETAGKRLQKDAAAGKATFVSLLGLDGARRRASELVAEAEAALDVYGDRAANLRAAARFVIARDL